MGLLGVAASEVDTNVNASLIFLSANSLWRASVGKLLTQVLLLYKKVL